MEEDSVRLNRIITATDLLKRWTGLAHEWELYDLIKKRDIQGYSYIKSLKSPDTGVVHFCFSGRNAYIQKFSDGDAYDWDGIVLDMSEVEKLERQRPEYCWPVVEGGHSTEINGDDEFSCDQSTYLTADDICKRWSLSPAQLVSIIQANKDLPVYWSEYVYF